jgi:hypothetical protein
MLLKVAVPKRITLYSVREFVRSLYYEEQEMQARMVSHNLHGIVKLVLKMKTKLFPASSILTTTI